MAGALKGFSALILVSMLLFFGCTGGKAVSEPQPIGEGGLNPAVPNNSVPVAKPAQAALAFETNGMLPDGEQGEAYYFSFCKPGLSKTSDLCGGVSATSQPSGGQPPYHFELGAMGGFPPMGLSLNANGVLSGTPAGFGISDFDVCAIDLSAEKKCQKASLFIAEKPAETPEIPPAPAEEKPQAWEGTMETSGRALCRNLAGYDAGEMAGKFTFTFTVPANLSNVLRTQTGEISVWAENNFGSFSGSETVARQSSDPECKLEGGSVSGVPIKIGVLSGSKSIMLQVDYESDAPKVLLPGSYVVGGGKAGTKAGLILESGSISDNEISGTCELAPGTCTFTLRRVG